jgi:hypothetical protein
MSELELSIVLPCLDEAATVSVCVRKAHEYLVRSGIRGEVIVADNGSIDGSIELAHAAGARVVHVSDKGYGSAILGGISAAQGRFVIMGDADDSYDFSQLDLFVEKLRAGNELVIGNRFSGGIAEGAMPILHRYLGNPVLSFLGRLFFHTKISDFHCGLRAFNRKAMRRLQLRSTGMEFASEMVVKAALAKLRIAEVPTTLSRDGRGRPPHLRTWRDGWRHLRFLLMLSPRWLFLYPGLFLAACGLMGQALLSRDGMVIGSIGFDIHTMLYSGAATIIGVQMAWFAIFARVYGTGAGLLPVNSRLEHALQALTLERGLAIGLVLVLGGVTLSAGALSNWATAGYLALEPRMMMRTTIPAVVMMIIGVEFIFSSFFLSLLRSRPAIDGQQVSSLDRLPPDPVATDFP